MVLELAGVEKAYRGSAHPVPVLKDISFTVLSGCLCAILGPSGSGKSTLLNIMGLLDSADSGEMAIGGQSISCATPEEAARLRNRLIGFVFQSFQLLSRLSAWENVALPLIYRGIPKPDRRRLATEMLERVGLEHRIDHRPNQLSGGQCQRVALARALIGEPKLILADEPTGSLDSATSSEMVTLLREINERFGVTVVMVTHDRALADQCDRRIELLDGRIIADTGTC